MRSAFPRAAGIVLIASALGLPSHAQVHENDTLTLQADALSRPRFTAAHGRRAVLMGYSGYGLEAWGYPFQLFTHYRLQFVAADGSRILNADALLRRIEERPDEIVRVYVGPEFEVREHLFVPLDRPAAILSYEVEGRNPPDLKITFLPVLNLMWPAALGGQDLQWRDALHGYVISEFTTGYRAILASPQTIAHTAVVNSTLRQDLTQSMVLHPVNGKAEVFSAVESRADAEGSVLAALEQNEAQLRAAMQAHADAALAEGMQIHTPDATLNRALAWSRLDLDQAWVCDPQVGCGSVGGYGPSRPERRPQYDWYFAGDGLVEVEGLLAIGDAQRARDELDFIFRYQNPANGMIWHEITQSAPFLDWANKYPYLYVHVDTTFDFLSVLADDYAQTGDLAFVREHWKQIAAAYGYCRSLINPQTGLPAIPAGKEGGNEQDRMSEDVSLSASWILAADGFAKLALAAGYGAEASEAEAASHAARTAFAARYWDEQSNFWIAGYAENGSVMKDERSHPELLGNALFTPAREDAALDRLASSAFQTDWGTRTLSAASPHYDPDSYAAGSVFAVASAAMAEAFWRDHRPAIALPIFESLLPWLQLDSPGHMHEVLAGDVYHAEVESVPEQTWSPAGLLASAVHGLFGVEVDAPHHQLTLAPHLDPHWGKVSLDPIAVGAARMAATIEQKPGEIDLTLQILRDPAQGGRVHVIFAPEIALGAAGVQAFVDGRPISATVERHGEDEHARVTFDIATGTVRCRVLFAGGIRVRVPAPDPVLGEASRGLKLISLRLDGQSLRIDADVAAADAASVEIDTPWHIATITGGAAVPLDDGGYRVTFADAPAGSAAIYARRTLRIDFREPSGRKVR